MRLRVNLGHTGAHWCRLLALFWSVTLGKGKCLVGTCSPCSASAAWTIASYTLSETLPETTSYQFSILPLFPETQCCMKWVEEL